MTVIFEVYVTQLYPRLRPLGRSQQLLYPRIRQMNQNRYPLWSELLTKDVGLTHSHPYDLAEPTLQRVKREKMLVFGVFALKVVPDLHPNVQTPYRLVYLQHLVL